MGLYCTTRGGYEPHRSPHDDQERGRDTAQGLLNFMNALGGGIGPAAVAGLTSIVPAPVALAVLAALPLAGLVLSLTRRPIAGPPLRTRRHVWEPAMTIHLHLFR